MVKLPKRRQNWLKSPINSAIGSILLAGSINDNTTISPNRMRILGKYAIIMSLAGEGFYEDANGYRSRLRPGDVVVVDPRLPHAYGTADENPWHQAYAVFEGPQFDLLSQSRTWAAHLPVWHLEPVHYWRERFEEILRPEYLGAPIQALQTVSRFTNLLIEMATSDAASREKPGETWLEDALRLLGEPQRGNWLSPQAVAKQLGQSYETFRKQFTSRVGTPPGQFQKQRRIDLACSAIYQGDDNFKTLAERLGFCDVYHFSKTFRQVVGSPPSEYRKTVRGR